MAISQRNTPTMHKQLQIRKRLKRTFNHRSHTLDKPFVQLNPYQVAPLTALIQFTTPKPASITLTIHGDTPIEKTFPGYHTIHRIPVIGLYANKKNRITITSTTHSGKTKTNTIRLKTQSLPKDFLRVNVNKADTERMENGLTFIVPSAHYPFAIDHEGNVRWYSTINVRQLFKPLAGGNVLIYAKTNKETKHNRIMEIDFLGQIYNTHTIYSKPNIPKTAINTDAVELSNNNLLVTTHEETADSVADKLTEVDRETGQHVRSLHYQSLFPGTLSQNGGDWLHNNSIWMDVNDHTIIMTARQQDMVMKHRFPEGDINWILASPENWPASWENHLLTPISDSFKYPGGPHAVMTLPDQDGNPETIDILLFDNNKVLMRGDQHVSETFSRAVQYRIHETNKTVEEVWTYGNERGGAFFSPIVGDADWLPETNNRLITSGYIKTGNGRSSKVVEVTNNQPGEEVFEATISGFAPESKQHVFRAARLTI
ncbi:aryl-sulfate sulfotransferase [Lentibacillus halophilus]|uniref:Aryl-sulfate sulfotransferase n=1 Tax=Lentibacillus halophilus TaxID=295065 RepID=A0ABN0ZHI5_9BACI